MSSPRPPYGALSSARGARANIYTALIVYTVILLAVAFVPLWV